MYTAIGDYPNALASHKQCVLLAKQSKDELSEARELGNMGAVYIAMGDFENAVLCHEQHLKIAKDLGIKREEARAYSNLGSAYHYRGNFDKAMSYHSSVLELARELAEKAIEMRAYAGLGHAARCMQDLERAKQYHEQQLGIAEDLRDRAAEGRASSNLGKDRVACLGKCHLPGDAAHCAPAPACTPQSLPAATSCPRGPGTTKHPPSALSTLTRLERQRQEGDRSCDRLGKGQLTGIVQRERFFFFSLQGQWTAPRLRIFYSSK